MNWYKIAQKLWGKAGSGILFVCLEDQSALLLLRSEEVEDPNQWGIPGGAIKGTESYYSQDELQDVEEYDEQITWSSAMKETMEELGYFPSQFQRLGTTRFNKGNFVYTTFIVSIPLDKKKKMEELVRLNWENIDAQWFPLKSIMNIDNLHPGVQFTLNNYKLAQNKTISIAHVGHSWEQGCPINMIIDFIDKNIPNVTNISHDHIDLNKGRDFLKENKQYDIVILEYIYAHDDTKRQTEGFYAQSEKHSPQEWNNRLKQTNAKFIFAFGSYTEITGWYIGNIDRYDYKSESWGSLYTKKNIKTASPIMEKSDFDESGNPNYPDYYEIGHNEYVGMNIEGCKDYMWIFVYGKLEVYPAEFRQTHSRVIPRDKMSNATFSGRVTQCKNKTEISLHPRTLMSKYRDIPTTVISQLYDRFGTNAQIYII